MNDSRLARCLTVSSNIAIIVAAAVIVFATFGPRGGRNPPTSSSRLPIPGQAFPAVPGVEFSASRLTTILFLQTDCRYCNDSMEFYRALVQRSRTTHAKAKVIVISGEPSSTVAKHLSNYGISVDVVVCAPPYHYGISGTPTLVHIDSGGRVVSSYSGRLREKEEEEVLAKVDGL
jgi:hypothetical protein